MQKEIISLTGHEIIHFVFFKINCSLHYSLLRLIKLHQGCPCKKPENVCLGCRTLMCSSRRTLRRLSTPGHQKGRNSPAYSFIMLYLWQSIWETAKNKVYRQTCGFCASGNGPRMCLLLVPGGGWVASGRKRLLLSVRVIEPDGESGKCWICPLQTPKPKAWEMRTSSALLKLMDGSW